MTLQERIQQEIKSAMLLPKTPVASSDGQPTAAQELADPRYELVQQLLEYKRFKDTAHLLERQQHGEWILAAVAVGLVAYGLLSLLDARYRRIT